MLITDLPTLKRTRLGSTAALLGVAFGAATAGSFSVVPATLIVDLFGIDLVLLGDQRGLMLKKGKERMRVWFKKESCD